MRFGSTIGIGGCRDCYLRDRESNLSSSFDILRLQDGEKASPIHYSNPSQK